MHDGFIVDLFLTKKMGEEYALCLCNIDIEECVCVSGTWQQRYN